MSTSTADPANGTAAIIATLRAAGCVFAEREAALLVAAAHDAAELDDMVRQRAAGLPLEHVVGWADFCGLRIWVSPGVFVPRPRSELLVREAAGLAGPQAVVVDLACGSGAIGLAVAALAGAAELHAADISADAVQCARRNLGPAGGQVHRGDLFDALPGRLRGQVAVLVANVPYVPSAEVAFLPPEARLHEPLRALDGGADGLDVLRRVASGAGQWLRAGGHVLLETSAAQADTALAALSAAGLAPAAVTDAELGATVVIGAKAL
jgi:release factor glutamine methyltransferase